MNLPSNWDSIETKTFGEFVKPKADGYICRIIRAFEAASKNGRPMIHLYLDIANGQFKDNFKNLFKKLEQNNPQAKWPCIYYQCIDGNQLPYFKGVITAIQHSNQGYKFTGDIKTLEGKFIGVVFQEEFINADHSKSILSPFLICGTQRINDGSFEIPKPKAYIQRNNTGSSSGASWTDQTPPANNQFGGYSQPNNTQPANYDDDLPF